MAKADTTLPQWTVMVVYMAGDNNLSEEMIYAIKEMYRIGTTKAFDLKVQFDPSGIGAPIRRFVVSDHQKIANVIAGVEAKKVAKKTTGKPAVKQTLDEDGFLHELATFPYEKSKTKGKTTAQQNSSPLSEDSASTKLLKDFLWHQQAQGKELHGGSGWSRQRG